MLDGYVNARRFRGAKVILTVDDYWPALFILEPWWLVNAFFVISAMLFVVTSVGKRGTMTFYDFICAKIVRLTPR